MRTAGNRSMGQPQTLELIDPQRPRGMLANTLTALASATALIVSGVSLWETSLKQPNLQVYLGSNLAYTLDPWGSDEVLVVPITISNSGARDGAVLSLRLDMRNSTSGATDKYQASYTVDSSYFGATDDVTTFRHRPKTPFTPIVVSGRTSFAGTLLFYPVKPHERKLVDPKSNMELTISLATTKPDGWIDTMLATTPSPIAVKLEVPNFLPGALFAGELARLRPVETVARN